MEIHHWHVLSLFLSFAFALTVLIDGVTHLSMAKTDFPNTDDGKTGFINLMMYEIIVPVLSVFGLGMHIVGLHLDFVSYLPETATEGLYLVIGTATHGVLWLTMASLWTTCQVGTMTVRKISVPGQAPQIFVKRDGPAFCPQHKFLDGGYSLEGVIPMLKVPLSWILFVLTLVNLWFASRGYMQARHSRQLDENARHRRTMRGLEGLGPPSKSTTMEIIGDYETKV